MVQAISDCNVARPREGFYFAERCTGDIPLHSPSRVLSLCDSELHLHNEEKKRRGASGCWRLSEKRWQDHPLHLEIWDGGLELLRATQRLPRAEASVLVSMHKHPHPVKAEPLWKSLLIKITVYHA